VRKSPKERATAPRLAAAPLHELDRDSLSVFLYLALLPEETKAIVKELGLSVPGFRAAALGDVERCDVIADEIRARPDAAAPVLGALRTAFEAPPLSGQALDAESAGELIRLAGHEAALALAAWRVLSDRSAAVRAAAVPILEELARHYYGPGEGGPGGRSERERGAKGADDEDAAVRAGRLEQELVRARDRLREAEAAAGARAEEQRRRAEEQREKLQAALRDARARESQLAGEAARAREEVEGARRELAGSRAELEALRSTDAVSDAQRARADARDLEARAAALDARLERSRARERELERELEALQRGRGAGAPFPPRPPSGGDDEGTVEGDLASWLLPVYTREFYDSLARWDRRIQRAAFKQAHLLAADHRHPSLRALPLEGLPGYYRVRVATDVRLIYRRGERQNEVEVLSLIDREDLDRYIRQAKTRG
jgi:mRNA-degrading endonuclease RelE of RelBE toxin-antitoxin system